MSQLAAYAHGAPLHNIEAPIEDFAIEASSGDIKLHIETGAVVLTFSLNPYQAEALARAAATGVQAALQ